MNGADVSHVLTTSNPGSIGPPIGKYSHLVSVQPAVRWVFISGQVGTRADGSLPADMYGQAEQIFRNIEQLLTELNATPENLVRLLTFAVGEDISEFYRVRDEVYSRWFPDNNYCGHSLAVVQALAKPELHLEIEGWVALPAEA